MSFFRRSLLVLGLVPLLILAGACGSSGDDSDDDDDGGSSADATQPKGSDTSGSSGSGSTASSKGGNGKSVRNGELTGPIKVEISGDKKARFEAEGGGAVFGGAVILNFGDGENMVALTVGTEKDDPGGIALTTKELSTAGEWGRTCEINLDDSESGLKGEFTCKGIAAIGLGSTKTFKVTLTGSFAMKR